MGAKTLIDPLGLGDEVLQVASRCKQANRRQEEAECLSLMNEVIVIMQGEWEKPDAQARFAEIQARAMELRSKMPDLLYVINEDLGSVIERMFGDG